jgi:N-acetylglutamate synthase
MSHRARGRAVREVQMASTAAAKATAKAVASQKSAQDKALLLKFERAAVRAWPAVETINIDGWLWRYTGGGSQRANSVSPLDFVGRDMEAAVAECEWLYRSRRSPVLFQMSDVQQPAGLDELLESCGYRMREPVTTLTKPITVAPGAIGMDIKIANVPTDDWLGVYLATVSSDRAKVAHKILTRVPQPCVFVTAYAQGRPMSVALGVAHDGVVIAECVATAAAARRKGGARRVMEALEAWGGEHGATAIGLQAVEANGAAQALYGSLGYKLLGRYHYRIRDF